MEWIKRNCAQEFLLAAQLTLAQRGLLISLRDYAGAMNGIPAVCLDTVAAACGVSRYLFKKNWPVLVKFFTLRGDVWVHRSDQEQIDEYEQNAVKYKKSGEIGARRRWHKGNSAAAVQAEIPFSNDSPPINRPSQKLEARISTREVLPAASSLSGPPPPEAAAEPPPCALVRTPPPEYAKAVMQRCAESGLSIPDQKFIQKLWERFPNLSPAKLPRFPDQYSPGLWLQKTEAELGIQADTEDMRKPVLNAKERAQKESDDRALETLRKMRAANA